MLIICVSQSYGLLNYFKISSCIVVVVVARGLVYICTLSYVCQYLLINDTVSVVSS